MTPPAAPPLDPPLIVCPPSAPPPAAPPTFWVWSQQVPAWFWLLITFLTVSSCAGTAALYILLKEQRARRRGERLPGTETRSALAELERRVGGGTDMVSRALGRM